SLLTRAQLGSGVIFDENVVASVERSPAYISSTLRESFCVLAAHRQPATVFLLAAIGRQEDLWKTCVVFAAIANSRQDTNPLLYICSRRPWASDRGKSPRPSEFVSARSAPSPWRWDLRRKARSTLRRGI